MRGVSKKLPRAGAGTIAGSCETFVRPSVFRTQSNKQTNKQRIYTVQYSTQSQIIIGYKLKYPVLYCTDRDRRFTLIQLIHLL
jgi:predicted alpha/beta superfamily hydrolase